MPRYGDHQRQLRQFYGPNSYLVSLIRHKGRLKGKFEF